MSDTFEAFAASITKWCERKALSTPSYPFLLSIEAESTALELRVKTKQAAL